jgi:antitoxin component of MazEF toxin-antitoxin module
MREKRFFALKVRKLGKDLGVVLPKAVLKKLGVGEGDALLLIEIPNGYRVVASRSQSDH